MNKQVRKTWTRLPSILMAGLMLASCMLAGCFRTDNEYFYGGEEETVVTTTAFFNRVTSCSQISPSQIENMQKAAINFFDLNESFHGAEFAYEYAGLIITSDENGRTDSGIVYVVYMIEVNRHVQEDDGNLKYYWTLGFSDIAPDETMTENCSHYSTDVSRITYDENEADEHYRYYYGFETISEFEDGLKEHKFQILDRDIDEQYMVPASERPSLFGLDEEVTEPASERITSIDQISMSNLNGLCEQAKARFDSYDWSEAHITSVDSFQYIGTLVGVATADERNVLGLFFRVEAKMDSDERTQVFYWRYDLANTAIATSSNTEVEAGHLIYERDYGDEASLYSDLELAQSELKSFYEGYEYTYTHAPGVNVNEVAPSDEE